MFLFDQRMFFLNFAPDTNIFAAEYLRMKKIKSGLMLGTVSWNYVSNA